MYLVRTVKPAFVIFWDFGFPQNQELIVFRAIPSLGHHVFKRLAASFRRFGSIWFQLHSLNPVRGQRIGSVL